MKKHRKKITTIVVLVVVLIAAVTVTSGKYIYNSVWNYYLKSKGFYFESDLLNMDTKKNSLLKWDGSNINFSIKNSLNDKLISEYDISYKISCVVLGEQADYIECNLNGMSSSTYTGILSSEAKCINENTTEDVSSLSKTECEINGHTWYEAIASKDNYFNLVLTDETKEIDEVSVKVTAESLNPYHKTLVGIFNLNKVDKDTDEIIKKYDSFNDYDRYTFINTTNNNKCLQISWDASNYALDVDINTVLEHSTNESKRINKITIELLKKDSVLLDFYKTNGNKTYSVDDVQFEEKECRK